MAAVTKLKPGVRVRLTRTFISFYGNVYPVDLVGTVSKYRPFRNPATGEWMFWIWWDSGPKKGGMIPASILIRRK